jgi:hypothetical protein
MCRIASSYEVSVAGMINRRRLTDSKALGPHDLKMMMDSLLDEEKRMELDKTTSNAFSASRRDLYCYFLVLQEERPWRTAGRRTRSTARRNSTTRKTKTDPTQRRKRPRPSQLGGL